MIEQLIPARAWIEPDFGGRFAARAAQLKAAMRLLGQPGGIPKGDPLGPAVQAAMNASGQ